MPNKTIQNYQLRLIDCMRSFDWSPVSRLAQSVFAVWKDRKNVFLCGNGGSSANAAHIANDLLFFKSKDEGAGIKAAALSANPAVMTCLANDTGYENIFSFQVKQFGKKGDILIALSGSGNSSNILEAVNTAKSMDILTCAILGFDGGKCLKMVDIPIHFPVNDMQISEDLQLIVGHMLMQWLKGD